MSYNTNVNSLFVTCYNAINPEESLASQGLLYYKYGSELFHFSLKGFKPGRQFNGRLVFVVRIPVTSFT
jgi:hypothetical protein